MPKFEESPDLKKKSFFTRTMHLHTRMRWRLEICGDMGYNLFDNPPYFADLTSSDFYIFPNLKKFVSGRRFVFNEDVERAADEYFQAFTSGKE